MLSFVAQKNLLLVNEEYMRQIENHFDEIRKLSAAVKLSKEDLHEMLDTLWEDQDERWKFPRSCHVLLQKGYPEAFQPSLDARHALALQEASWTSLDVSVHQMECYLHERNEAPTHYNTDEPRQPHAE